MKIGIDIDEVVANHLEKLNQFYFERTGKKYSEEDYTSYNWWEVWEITKEKAIQIDKDFKSDSLFRGILPIGGSLNYIKLLAKNSTLFFITSRPKEIMEETKLWLKNYLPNISFEVIFTGDFHGNGKTKAEVCHDLNVDILIEDNAKYAMECANNNIFVLLFDKPWNKKLFTYINIQRVFNWSEIFEKINLKINQNAN